MDKKKNKKERSVMYDSIAKEEAIRDSLVNEN